MPSIPDFAAEHPPSGPPGTADDRSASDAMSHPAELSAQPARISAFEAHPLPSPCWFSLSCTGRAIRIHAHPIPKENSYADSTYHAQGR